jgi:sialic acid synthase SpsE
MKKEIKIGNKIIGKNHPLFITAEIGITCNYDIKITKQLIDVVHDTGADAVKLIFWFPEEIMSDKTINYDYDTVNGRVSENMFEMLDKLRFSFEQWKEIKKYADSKNVILFATVNSPGGINFAERLNLDAYKLSSWDFNHIPFYKKIASKGKPMLIDTGPVNTLEVAKVMQVMKDANNDLGIMVHCIHTKEHSKINMNSIPYMQKAFNTLVGYSSADQDTETDIMAVTMGAVYIEKRLTMNRSLLGHHHILSFEPQEFKDYVKLMRNVQAALGVEYLIPSEEDLKIRKKGFRHIVANTNIKAGTILTEEMLEGKRPENGISPEYMDFFIGREIKKDLKYNEALVWDIV